MMEMMIIVMMMLMVEAVVVGDDDDDDNDKWEQHSKKFGRYDASNINSMIRACKEKKLSNTKL